MSLELGRRLVHASGVGLPALYLLSLVSWAQLQWLLIGGSAIALGLETLRLHRGLELWIFEHLTRPYETETFAGYGYYMLSITGIALAFDPVIAIPAMLMLMLGDPISGMTSTDRPGRFKGWPAVASMYIVSLVVSLPFLLTIQPSAEWALIAAMIGAIGAVLADGIQYSVRGRIIDDNLLIPIFGATALWLAIQVLPPG